MSKEIDDDAARAANSPYRVTAVELRTIIEKYRQRIYIDDIEYIEGHLGGIESILDKLDLDPTAGASANSLEAREDAFGTNFKPPPRRTGFCVLLYQALDDFMLKLLIVCAIIQIVIDMSFADAHDLAHAWIEGFGILVAVAIVSLVTAWSDHSKEEQFLKQQSLAESTKTVTVLRDSKEAIIHMNNVKVGDKIKIKNGMNIPVDGVILEAVGVMSDEAAMTGESDHLAKETITKCLSR